MEILMWIGIYLLASYLIVATLVLIEEGGLGAATLLALLGIPLVIYKIIMVVLYQLTKRHIRKYLGIYTGSRSDYKRFGVDTKKYQKVHSISVFLKILSTRKLTITEEERLKYVKEYKYMGEDDD
ncbi:hypothetical protein [Listeria welshimeri]|uniref:hypothetical protein n=1 Tax=Listeria welshimeri TaxID=1643 RepID=UPI001888866C|nr:hypothetical protein [Listeria welshimeri]MBF2342562.1 hypothetical protein [Listeria welshimeri]